MLRDKPFQLIKDLDEETAKIIDGYIGEMHHEINNRVPSRGFETTTPGTANVEFRVTHNLGYIPINFLLVDINASGRIYRSTQAWDKTNAYLKCTVASAKVRVIIW